MELQILQRLIGIPTPNPRIFDRLLKKTVCHVWHVQAKISGFRHSAYETCALLGVYAA